MNEVCPSCGAFVAHLQERTGWCAGCSIREGRRCLACHEHKPVGAYSADKARRDGRRPVCRACDTRLRREREHRRRVEAAL